VLGTKDSPQVLTRLEYEWYTEDEPSTAPIYCARAVLPYLLTGNVRAANQCFLLFTAKLGQANPSLGVQEISSKSNDIRVYSSLPLLNFLGLLLLAVQRGSPDLFRQLKSHYAAQLKEVGTWGEAMDQLGELFFGIKIPTPGNPFMNMMGNMMMSGMGAGKKKAVTPKKGETPAPAPTVD